MKKRLLIGLALGAMVFAAVFAVAAALGVTSDDLSAGSDAVVSCDTDGVTTSYTVAFDGAPDSRYEVTQVTVGGIVAACVGKDLNVTLADSANNFLASGNATAASPTTVVAMTPNPSAAAVENVHVEIDG